MRCGLVTLLLIAMTLAGCVNDGPTVVPQNVDPDDADSPTHLEPLALGAHSFHSFDYDAGTTKVGGKDGEHSNYSYDARLRGRLWIPDGVGPWPVLVFLHGQHATCADATGREALFRTNNCGDESGILTPYPNHLGYAYLAKHLASHGFAVASILGHEVNEKNGAGDTGMWARGELVLATLDALRDGASGMPDQAKGTLDLSRVGIMGHSRGGEGVVTAMAVNAARPAEARHSIRAVVALAPTDFNGRGVEDAALLSLIPFCDGDVQTLHGLRTFDHSRWANDSTAKVQIVVRGTNHNDYNTKWGRPLVGPIDEGDDAQFGNLPGTYCHTSREQGGARVTIEETLRESILHVGGFLRWQVGGDASLAPYFSGAALPPADACPAHSGDCSGFALVSATLKGTRPVLVANDSFPTVNSLGGSVVASGFSSATVCAFANCDPNVYSSAPALDLRWAAPASLRIEVPADSGDWSAMRAFSLRVAVPTMDGSNKDAQDFVVEFEDASGARATLRASEVSAALDLPRDHYATIPPAAAFPILGGDVGASKITLNAVRIPLADLPIDVARVTSVTLSFGEPSSGRVLVTDFQLSPR